MLLIATTFVDFIGGILIDKFRGKTLSKVFVGITSLITLSSLFLFKYSDFFAVNINEKFNTAIPFLGLALPIGISFYTFQALTYVIDVYRDKVKVQPSFYKLLLYVSMFPQLIAGPIVRYSDVEKEINEREVTLKGVSSGIVRFSVGLLKKAIIANMAGELTKKLIGGDLKGLSAIGAWVGIIAYAIQIYFDFSGYSDMAIGLGKIFGFNFPENFNYPYCAKSISDFWKRWHMTLSSFFRDYLYIPLGGNKKHWAFNMLIVWALTGFWHGAAWNFILWGLYYFVFLMIEKIYLKDFLEKIPSFFSHLYTIIVFLIGWVFFYFDDMSKLKYFFSAAFGFENGFISLTERTIIVNYAVLLIVGIIACLPIADKIKMVLRKFSVNLGGKIFADILTVAFVFFALFVSTAALVGSSFNPFLYFRF
ncbi:MAG: MBOAT family O-acyltransferase [Oscillospiraceae bacterium]